MNDRHEAALERIAKLANFAASVNLEEVVWEKGDQRIAFKRRLHTHKSNGSGPASKETAQPSESPKHAPAASPFHYVRSPMVGTFWRSPSKDRPPLVVEGDEITAGERVAVVEAMKVPKDVISDARGRIVKILVENGKPVEYGQKLFEVELA